MTDLQPQIPAGSIVPDWLRAWGPALLWAAMMFYASTDALSSQNISRFLAPFLRWLNPAITQHQLDVINFFIRKCAHLAEYFIFYLLVYRGVSRGRRGWRWRRGLCAWFIVAAYSVLDEIHQSFVISRTASPWDVLLDSTGALAGMVGAFLLLRFLSPGRTD